MLREVYKVDENGFLLPFETIVIDNDCPEGYIDLPVPEKLFRPRLVDGAWIEGGYPDLESYKEKKINELFSLREQQINSTFTSVINEEDVIFDYSIISQTRFKEMAVYILIDPAITSIEWRSVSHGFLLLTREEFMQVLKDAASHKASIEYKYTYAKAHIDNAETTEEVDAIVLGWWDE